MKSLIILAIAFSIGTANATVVSAVGAGGDWTSAGTWDVGVPGCYDTIIIPAGATVNVNTTIDLEACGPIAVLIAGELHFESTNKLELPCDSYVYIEPGPPEGALTADDYGNNNKKLTICGDIVWKSKDGPLGGGVFLDINLSYFRAKLVDSGVLIEWETLSESNNDFFRIERSEDGVVWEVISQVEGAGNSSYPISYEDHDRDPIIGVSYYRLEQTDFDGSTETFDPVAVSVSHTFSDVDLIIFPNPNDGNQFSVYVPGEEGDPIDVMIYTANGQVVYNEVLEVSSGGLIVVRLEGLLEAGTYIFSSKGRVARLIIE